jgi:hypothetical protein
VSEPLPFPEGAVKRKKPAPFPEGAVKRGAPSKDGQPAHLGPIPLGFDVPEWASPIFNFGNSYKASLANLIGAPVELVDQAFRMAGSELLENEGDAQAALRRGFSAAGLPTDTVDGLSAELGKAAFESQVSLIAMAAAAPKMLLSAVQKAQPRMGEVVDQIGRWMIEQPWIAALTEFGTQMGGPIGERTIGDIPVPFTDGKHTLMSGEAIGGLVGGGAAGGLPGFVKVAGKSVPTVSGLATGAAVGAPFGPGVAIGTAVIGKTVAQRTAGSAWRFFRKGTTPRPDDTMLPEPRPMSAASRVDEYVQTQMLQAEKKIDDVIASLPPQDAEEYSIALREGLYKAQKAARAIESEAYPDWFLKQQTEDVGGLIEAAVKMSNQLDIASPRRPSGEISRILRQFGEKTEIGYVSRDNVYGSELQSLRSDLAWAARDARSGESPNKPLAINLEKLVDAADAELRRLPGGDEQVDYMHKISKELNDFFFRGPMLELFRKRKSGAPLVPPGKTADKLLVQERGLGQIRGIAERYDQPGLMPLTRNAVRAHFRKVLERAESKPSGPATRGRPGAAAQRWMQKHESAVNSFADESVKLQQYTDQLLAAQNEIIGINKGSLLRFTKKDPDKGVDAIFGSGNPAQSAAEIRAIVAKDPEALAGFEHDFLVQLFQRNRYSAKKLYDSLTEGHPEKRKFGGATARLVEAALGEEKALRLLDIAKRVSMIETGETKITGVGGPIFHYVYDFAARVGGAAAVKGIIDQPTIQQAGAGATFTTSFVKRLAGKLDYSEVFSLVVNDPKWEQIVMNEVPLTAKDVRKLNNQMRMLFALEEATREEAPSPAKTRTSLIGAQ